MAKGRVQQEFDKIQFALESDEITPKQRMALLITRHTLKWFVSFGHQKVVPSPTDKILPDFFDKTVESTE